MLIRKVFTTLLFTLDWAKLRSLEAPRTEVNILISFQQWTSIVKPCTFLCRNPKIG